MTHVSGHPYLQPKNHASKGISVTNDVMPVKSAKKPLIAKKPMTGGLTSYLKKKGK